MEVDFSDFEKFDFFYINSIMFDVIEHVHCEAARSPGIHKSFSTYF